MKIKNVNTTINNVIDKETGEVLEVDIKKVSLVVDKEKFALVYSYLWNTILESNLSISDIELLSYLILNYSGGSIFTISKTIKEIVASKAKKKASSYNNSTKKLIDNEFILKVDNRNYVLNPKLVYEGSSTNRKKLIISIIEGKNDNFKNFKFDK